MNGKVLTLDRNLEDTLPYLFSLVGIEAEQVSLQQRDAQIRRQRTFEALKKLFLGESLNQPLLFIVEDLHWLDNETQGFLDTLTESVASANVLLLVNYRPEYHHEWGMKTYYTQLRLAPLGKVEAEELLALLLGTDTSLTALKALIMERADGTPFFMEEVVQTLVEEGALKGERGSYHLETIPSEFQMSPTVQGVLAARIDRLTAEEKSLLQRLAVIGRQFPFSLVKQVIGQTEGDGYRILGSLQAKEFLYEQPAFPESEYMFKHALTQDAAYGTVLQEQRKALHERTGQAIEGLYRTSVSDHYSELAYHYSRSENADKAVEYLGLAGHQAVQRSAYAEAVSHFTSVIELLQTLPDTTERHQQELGFQVALSVPLSATRGYYAAPEVGDVYLRARELCEEIEDPPELFPALYGLYAFYANRAEHKTAHELTEQLLHLAHSRQDTALLLVAHWMTGTSLSLLGEFASAHTHLEQGIALYDASQHHALALSYASLDPAANALSFAALVLWQLGYPEQALIKSHEALDLAQELSHPFSLGSSLSYAAMLHQFRREGHAAQEQAEAAIGLSTEQGFPYWSTIGATLQGRAVAEHGQVAKGITQMNEGLAAWQAMRDKVFPITFSCLISRSLWERRASRSWTRDGGRGTRHGGANGRALL